MFVLCLADVGSEDIQVLPNGLAFITSVSHGGRLQVQIGYTITFDVLRSTFRVV